MGLVFHAVSVTLIHVPVAYESRRIGRLELLAVDI